MWHLLLYRQPTNSNLIHMPLCHVTGCNLITRALIGGLILLRITDLRSLFASNTCRMEERINQIMQQPLNQFKLIRVSFCCVHMNLNLNRNINTRRTCKTLCFHKNRLHIHTLYVIDYSHIVLIIAIWPGDRICRPEHSTVEHGSCDERV